MIRILQATVAGSLLALALDCRIAVAANSELAPSLTVDQIVERYISARGGTQAWEEIQTMSWSGHLESETGGVNKTPFVMLFKRPDATRFEMIVQGQHLVRAFDGAKGWKLQPTNSGVPEVKQYSAEELSYARDAAGLDGPLFGFRAKGVKIESRGEQTVEGHEAYCLKLTLPSGQVRTDWIDAKSFLELKYDRDGRNPAGPRATVSVYYRNYQTVQGLVMPFVIETAGAGSNETNRMVIDKIAINPPLEQSLFAEPRQPGRGHKGVVIDTTKGR
jgi:hypothetical protein